MATTFTKISADEARGKRKNLVTGKSATGSDNAILKAARSPRTWNKDKRSARFTMTTEAVDRYGDIVATAGAQLDNFLANPVGLLVHNSRSWPIGRWEEVEKLLNGRPKRMEGTLAFLPEGGPVPEVDQSAWMVEQGGITACSIGFVPDWDNIEMINEDGEWTGGLKFNAWELIECSICPVPAHPGALVKSADGDNNLAREFVEDVLDNWTPMLGELVSRKDFETTHSGLIVPKSMVIIDKSLLPQEKDVPTFTPGELKLEAKDNAEASALAGAPVRLDPAHAENKSWPFDLLAKSEGEIIAAWIVDQGEYKGQLALAVEFLTDEYSGMFRGILAERFLRVEPKAVEEAPAPEVVDQKTAETASEDDSAETKELEEFLAAAKDGDTLTLQRGTKVAGEEDGFLKFEDDGSVSVTLKSGDETKVLIVKDWTDAHAALAKSFKERTVPDEVPPAPTDKLELSVSLDTSQVEKDVGLIDGLLTKLHAKFPKFFGSAEKQVPEPVVEEPAAPPSAEAVAAAKTKAAALVERAIAAGRA